MADKPQQATAAQMARRRIASTRKPSGSARSSRAGTPTAPNSLGQQSMPSFQPPTDIGGSGFDGGFNFTAGGSASNPFAQQNGSATPPPSTFQFGQQQNGGNTGGSGMFGNSNPSFGSTFGSTSQTPQQNGFNPSTNSIFANQSQAQDHNDNPFKGFGQTSQPQQNGLTPSTATTSSFPSFGKQNNSENPFKNFGQNSQQQNTQSTPSTSFGGLGANQQNGDKAQTTPSFGGFGQQQSQQTDGEKPSSFLGATPGTAKTTQSSIFSSFGQQPNNTATSKPGETPKTNTSSLFSGLQQNNSTTKGLFGSTATPPSEQTSKGGESVLTGLTSERARSITPNMFTQGRSETPKTGGLFNFGQQNDTDGAKDRQETPRASASNLFSGAQTNGVKLSNMFGSATSTSAEQTETPTKPSAAGLFSSAPGWQSQQQSSTPTFNFGQSQSQQDTSMTTPGNTPQKSSNLFDQGDTSTTAPAETPAAQGKSLFDRVGKDSEPPATAHKTFTPSTSLFSQPPANTSTAIKENETPAASASQGGSHYGRTSRDPPQTPATAQKQQPQTSFIPSTSLFSKPASQSSKTPSAAPWLSHAPPSTPSAPPATKVTPPTPQPPVGAKQAAKESTMNEVIPESEKSTFKVLNEGLTKHLATQDPNVDWTTIMQYYLQQAAKIRKKPEPTFEKEVEPTSAAAIGSTSSVSSIKPASDPRLAQPASSNQFSSTTTPKTPSFTPSTSNMFAATSATTQQQTPKPAAPTVQTAPPATAPVSKKRKGPFEDDDDDEGSGRAPPATEKRARVNEPINDPKLPENASETAKLFQAALNKPRPEASETAGQKETQTEAPSSSGFKPTTSSSTGFKPLNTASTAAGPPTFSAPTAGSGGFLAAFGKKANAEEEKERKKRKAEDFDSDDETEEEWAKRDREEQEIKRQKILDDSKRGSGFTVSAATSREATPSISNIFGDLSKSHASEKDKAEPQKEQGPGDNTWKPSTPIKFGVTSSTTAQESTTPAAPPPAFGNLFGSIKQTSATGSNGLLGVPGAKPTIGFNFGVPSSIGTSRATTPGVTTDGEGASTAGEADDDEIPPNEPQMEDKTDLLPEEKAANELLFSHPSIKAQKWGDKKDADSGEMKKGWVEKGNGPLYVLKPKDGGNAWVLQKIPSLGHIKMKFPILPGVDYVVAGKAGKMVQGAFVDRLEDEDAKTLSRWIMIADSKDKAEELAKILMENRPAAS